MWVPESVQASGVGAAVGAGVAVGSGVSVGIGVLLGESVLPKSVPCGILSGSAYVYNIIVVTLVLGAGCLSRAPRPQLAASAMNKAKTISRCLFFFKNFTTCFLLRVEFIPFGIVFLSDDIPIHIIGIISGNTF